MHTQGKCYNRVTCTHVDHPLLPPTGSYTYDMYRILGERGGVNSVQTGHM